MLSNLLGVARILGLGGLIHGGGAPAAGGTHGVSSTRQVAANLLHVALVCLRYGMILQALFSIAFALYAVVYWAAMPAAALSKRAYFDYGPGALREPPVAVIELNALHSAWTPSNETARLIPAAPKSRILAPSQHYTIDMELDLPHSAMNERVGVFMVHAELEDDAGAHLGKSARAALLPHRDPVTGFIRAAIGWPLVLSGVIREVDTVRVPLFDFFAEPPGKYLARVRVSLTSRDIQVASAWLTVSPQHEGLQWFMSEWFYTSASIGISFFMSIEMLICAVIYVLVIDDNASSGAKGVTGATAVGLDRPPSLFVESAGRRVSTSNTMSTTTLSRGSGTVASSTRINQHPRQQEPWEEAPDPEPLLVSGQSYHSAEVEGMRMRRPVHD